jgi:tight adherence protein B
MTPLADWVVIALAAVGGGLGAVAATEAIRSAPGVAAWLNGALDPLVRAGNEGYAPSTAERRRLGLLAAALALFAGTWLLGPAPAAPLAAAGPAAAGWLLSTRAAGYRRSVERELPRIATATADALAAGRSIRAALGASSGSLEGAAGAEMARVTADLDLGVAVEPALAGLRERLRSPLADSFCTAVLSQRIAGGDLVSLLRRFAEAAAERQRIEADARTATAQARFTGLLVVAMPAGAALLAELLDPGFVAGLFGNGASLVLLTLAAFLQFAGFLAIRKIARVAGP